jgi:5'-methylthioadenosine phosphorylase
MRSPLVLGIIGGSGFHDLPLEKAEWKTVESPWGLAIGPRACGDFHGLPVGISARHGRGHVYSPTSINYRPNIDS